MEKKLIFECDDYVVWEINEVLWINPDGSYTPTYSGEINIIDSHMNHYQNFVLVRYHWTQPKLKSSNRKENEFPEDLQPDPSPSIVNETFFDISDLTNKELEQKLYEEFMYYSEDLDELCHIIRKQLPRKMVYRLISKMYRLRGAK